MTTEYVDSKLTKLEDSQVEVNLLSEIVDFAVGTAEVSLM
ncbi:Uncharacterised protein [Chlamydia trachomatis]|nr:Uncharacterised protein [Chlamydia trachomatis]